MGFKPIPSDKLKAEPKFPVATSLPQSQLRAFEQMAEENGLNKSDLLRQMVDYCMGLNNEVPW